MKELGCDFTMVCADKEMRLQRRSYGDAVDVLLMRDWIGEMKELLRG